MNSAKSRLSVSSSRSRQRLGEGRTEGRDAELGGHSPARFVEVGAREPLDCFARGGVAHAAQDGAASGDAQALRWWFSIQDSSAEVRQPSHQGRGHQSAVTSIAQSIILARCASLRAPTLVVASDVEAAWAAAVMAAALRVAPRADEPPCALLGRRSIGAPC